MKKILKILWGICLIFFISTLSSFAKLSFAKSNVSIEFLKRVSVGVGARPEVVATKDRVFVVYLDTATRGKSIFSVKIYDKDMNSQIAYKILVSQSLDYGRPTDIRVASDGKYLYAFYETVQEEAYLWGAKYTLDDNFQKIAHTPSYIAKSPIFTKTKAGDELVNDPIALIGPNSVFVITRIKQESFSQEGHMIYRVREFTNDLQTKLSEFDLNLSSVADGSARQASAVYYNAHYYMVVPTTTGSGNYFESMATPSDLLLVKLDKNWEIIESKNLSQDHNDIETFVLGFKIYNDFFFITYKQGYKQGSGPTFVCPLKVYDQKFNLISSKIVKKAAGRGESLRSTLEVTDDRIYVSLSAGQGPSPPAMGQRNAGQNFPPFKREQRMRQERSKFPQPQGLFKDKSTVRSREEATAEVYIYDVDWRFY